MPCVYYNRSNPTSCAVCFSASAKLTEDKAAYFSMLQTMLNRLQEARYVGSSSEQTDCCIIYIRGNTERLRRCLRKRQREKGRERQRQIQRQRQTETETDRGRDREKRERQRQRQGQTETDTERLGGGQTDRQTDRQTERQTDRQR